MKTNTSVSKAFIPSLPEAIVLASVAAASLFLLNVIHILKSYGSSGDVVLSEYLHTNIQRFAHSLDKHLGTQVLSVIFWMLVGSAVYVIGWAVAVMVQAYRNDIPVLHGFIVPTGYGKRNSWHAALARILTRILATGALIYWFYVFFVKIMPYASRIFLASFDVLQLKSIIGLSGAIILIMMSLFGFTIFLRLIFLRVRVFR